MPLKNESVLDQASLPVLDQEYSTEIPGSLCRLVSPVTGRFSAHTFLGREKGTRDQAPEASADLSIFPAAWVPCPRVSALFAERNLHLVISGCPEIQPLILHQSYSVVQAGDMDTGLCKVPLRCNVFVVWTGKTSTPQIHSFSDNS